MASLISETEELFLAHTRSKRSIARKLLTFEDRSFLTQAREGLEPYFRWQAIKNRTNPSPTVARSQPQSNTSNRSQFCKILYERWKFGYVPNLNFSPGAHMKTASTVRQVPLTFAKKDCLQPLVQTHWIKSIHSTSANSFCVTENISCSPSKLRMLCRC